MLTKEQFKLAFDINIVVYDIMSDMHKISLRLLRLMKAVARRNKIGNDLLPRAN